MAKLVDLARGVDYEKFEHSERAYLLAATKNGQNAIQDLTTIVFAALPTGIHSRRGIEKLVRIHFGYAISFVSVRKDLRSRAADVMALHEIVRATLGKIRARLLRSLDAAQKAKSAKSEPLESLIENR